VAKKSMSTLAGAHISPTSLHLAIETDCPSSSTLKPSGVLNNGSAEQMPLFDKILYQHSPKDAAEEL
jgi:hypothetical protein